MSAKNIIILVVALSLSLPSLFCTNVYAQMGNYSARPSNRPINPASTPNDTQTLFRQIKTAIGDLKYELNNHEAEMKTFENRLQNQESILESVRQHLTDSIQAQEDYAKAQSAGLENKVDSLDETVKILVSDMKSMRNQSNEFVTILGQYKQKLSEFEKLMDAQNTHMKNLEVALNTMLEAMQPKSSQNSIAVSKNIDASGFRLHKVQKGENLEKIAGIYKVPVQSIRDTNKLTQDRIYVGQTLKIP